MLFHSSAATKRIFGYEDVYGSDSIAWVANSKKCGEAMGSLLQFLNRQLGRSVVHCELYLNCPSTLGLHAATNSLFYVQNSRLASVHALCEVIKCFK